MPMTNVTAKLRRNADAVAAPDRPDANWQVNELDDQQDRRRADQRQDRVERRRCEVDPAATAARWPGR